MLSYFFDVIVLFSLTSRRKRERKKDKVQKVTLVIQLLGVGYLVYILGHHFQQRKFLHIQKKLHNLTFQKFG